MNGKGNTSDYMEKDEQLYSSLDKDNPISRHCFSPRRLIKIKDIANTGVDKHF